MGRSFGRHYTSLRMTRQRGQVLIIAVLVLFAVASVAALLAAIVGAQIVQVSRYADVSDLQEAAESILWLANEQLSYGWQGADWRPPRDPYHVGKAIVGLTVNYGPLPPALGGSVQSRYLRISVAARFPDDPFLRYSALALKPLLLTDYARFITDRYELRQPAALGAGGVELGGRPRPNTIKSPGYEFTVDGPIRSNTDLEWYGRSQVNLFTPHFTGWSELGLFRDDRIEVAGVMRPALRPAQPDVATHNEPSLDANRLMLSVDGVVRTDSGSLFSPDKTQEQDLYASGFADEVLAGLPVTNTWRVLADLPRYQAMFPTDPDDPELSTMLSVPRVQPPRLDAMHPEMHTNRYLILTRDSGKWNPVGVPPLNTGINGWGWTNYGGIYLDNYEDIQYGHDLDRLRRNWMGGYRQREASADGRRSDMANPPADWWDRTGRYYTPPGVEVILHGEAPCPYIEIVRHTKRLITVDSTPLPYYWKDQQDKFVQLGNPPITYAPGAGECRWPGAAKIYDNMATFPFPGNGVIYAEGNVRIRGVMPKNGNNPSLNPADAPKPYFGATLDTAKTPAVDRCYDLQVVSGGTIYIEGELLSATAAKLYPESMTMPADIAAWDRDRAARLALIARDDVCVNTTALQPRPAKLEVDDGVNLFNDGQPVYPDPSSSGYPTYMFFRGVDLDANDPSLVGLKPPVPTEPLGPKGEPAKADFVYTSVRLQLARLKAGLPELRLVMGHSGWYVAEENLAQAQPAVAPWNEPNRQAQVQVKRFLNDMLTPWKWSQGEDWYTFRGPGVGSPTKDASDHWYIEANRAEPFGQNQDGNANCDYAEFLPNDPQTMLLDPAKWADSAQQLIAFEPQVVAVRHVEDEGPPPVYKWDVRPNQLGYILGPVAVGPLRETEDGQVQAPLPVEIHALVYAQNGSWFILPGPWFNEDPDEVYESEPGGPYPAYHEPLNIALRFYGAISENMPAPIGDVTDWTSKWAGPYGARGGFLTYSYDPVLRWYRWDALRPVFPNFLLTPDLIVWGERVAGATGAGT